MADIDVLPAPRTEEEFLSTFTKESHKKLYLRYASDHPKDAELIRSLVNGTREQFFEAVNDNQRERILEEVRPLFKPVVSENPKEKQVPPAAQKEEKKKEEKKPNKIVLRRLFPLIASHFFGIQITNSKPYPTAVKKIGVRYGEFRETFLEKFFELVECQDPAQQKRIENTALEQTYSDIFKVVPYDEKAPVQFATNCRFVALNYQKFTFGFTGDEIDETIVQEMKERKEKVIALTAESLSKEDGIDHEAALKETQENFDFVMKDIYEELKKIVA